MSNRFSLMAAPCTALGGPFSSSYSFATRRPESGQSCRVGDPRAAEERHLTVFVRFE